MDSAHRRHTIAIAFCLCVGISACSTTAGPEVQLTSEGSLHPCPASPNCVSSLAEDSEHFIEPWVLRDEKNTTWQALVDVIKKQPRTQLRTQQTNFVHAECHTASGLFTDDLLLLKVGSLVHLRSSSRVGHYDFQANRKRVAALRQEIAEQGLIASQP